MIRDHRQREGTTTMAFEIINPDTLAPPRGWNHGMLAPESGRLLFVAGQAATDVSGSIVGEEIVGQFEQALRNTVAVVREAGGGPEHIGQMTIYVTDVEAYRASFKPLGEAYRTVMGKNFPAMALIGVSELLDPRLVVEIEATAVLPSAE
jgi:enamine deaminase RidA (YjgF/YER057c/UK114 family)